MYYKNPNSPNAVSPEEATTDATVAGMAYFGPPDEAMTFIYFGIDKTYPGGYKGYSKDVNGLLDKGYKKLYNFIINH